VAFFFKRGLQNPVRKRNELPCFGRRDLKSQCLTGSGWLNLAHSPSQSFRKREGPAPKFRMKFKNWKIRGYFRDPRCLAWRLSSLSRHSQLDTCLHCKLYSQLSLHGHFGMALSEVSAPSRTPRLVTLTHSLLLFGAASSDRCTIEHQCSQEETLVERGSYIGNMMGNYART